MNADTRAVLCDFGLAKAISETGLASGMTTSRTLKMSLRYSSPELLNDLEPSHSLPSDVWALGCLFLEVRRNVLFINTDALPYPPSRLSSDWFPMILSIVMRELCSLRLPEDNLRL